MKKLTRKLLLCSIFCFCAIITFAQQRTVTGTIKDNNGAPVVNASVIVKGTTSGVATDANGHFSISVNSSDAVLVISSVNYKSKEVAVRQSNNLSIIMEGDNAAMQEVVVTALGITQKNRNLGYSVSTIKGEEIDRTNTVNPITALQGKVAGVNINVMGAAGIQTSPSIQIRGASVLGNTPGQANNQPIFVIDGNVITNNLQDADGVDPGSQLKNLNPDDYESITVLKGAAATSIYGSRGLNGAVVITTKKGKKGSGFGIDFTSTYQTTHVYKAPMALQNTYGRGSWATREGNFAPDGTQANTGFSFGPQMDGSMHPAVYDNTKMVPYSPQPDNWKVFYQDGKYVNNNLALSGASDKFHYRMSYTNNNSDGILPKNGLKRNSIDINVGGDINKVFSTELGISYANTVTSNFFGQGRYYYSGGQNLAFNTYYMPRNIDMASWYASYRNPDNTINSASLYGNLPNVTAAFSRFDKDNFKRNENSVLAYLQLKAQVTPWLDLSGKANINYLKIFSEEKDKGNNINNTGGYYSSGGSYTTDYDLLFMAHATTRTMHDNLGIDFRIINEIYGNRLGENYGSNTNGGLSVPNQFFLLNSVLSIQNNNYYKNSYPSTLTYGLGGILSFNYKDFLNVEFTGRNDWLSTLAYPAGVLGANNFSVFYPSVNTSYSFYDNFKSSMPDWLSSGRLRGSLAYVGNAGVAGAYATGNGYSPNTMIGQNGNSVGIATGFNADVKPNLNLKPQHQRAIEFGTNFSVFKDLINVDFAWYKNNTFNQLLNLPGVLETGYSKLFINAGNIQNKGYELLVTVTPIRKKDWSLDFSVNMASNHSKIVKFGNGIKEWELSGGYDGANVYAYEGGAFGVLTAETWAASKIDPKTGYPIIEIQDSASSTNPASKYAYATYGYVAAPDSLRRVKIGNVEPKFTGGVSANLRYKNFTLFAQVDGRFGGYVYSEAYNYAMAQGTLEASLKYRDKAHGGVERIDSYTGQTRYDGAVINGVFDQGQVSPNGTDISGMTFKQAYDKGLVGPMKAAYYYVNYFGWGTNINNNGSASKNSWVMFRELTIGYRVPTAIANKIHLRGARINLTARNIGYLYKTLSDDQNPESLQSNDPFRPYITGGVPFSRNYAVTLNISL
ncbi:MAG: SusC/RagA family TonB-linked outer membrane protein [Ginsengibacter sp.]